MLEMKPTKLVCANPCGFPSKSSKLAYRLPRASVCASVIPPRGISSSIKEWTTVDPRNSICHPELQWIVGIEANGAKLVGNPHEVRGKQIGGRLVEAPIWKRYTGID